MISYAKTDTGLVRRSNQDFLFAAWISRWDRFRICSSWQTEWADIRPGISRPGMSWNI